MSTSSARTRPRNGRAGRLVLLCTAAVLAVLIAVVWILPGMLDWNRYRSSIASLVAAGIGRPVEIDGDITLHLLPQPFLTAAGLKVNDARDGVVMQVKEVRLRVALGPLIGGRVDARELTLHGADLRLPWPPPPGALSRRPPAWLTGLQARVEESRLQVGDFVMSGVDASLGADPDTGTLSAAGAATLFGLPWHFTARLGRPAGAGAAPLDVSLDGQGRLRDTGGTFSGEVEAGGALSGRVTARGPDLSQVMPAPAVAWRGDGRLSASGGLAVADELALEIGGAPARGAVALRVQPDFRLDLALAVSRLDLDAWTPVLLRSVQPGKQAGVPTGIDLSADVATLAGGTIRQLRTAFDIDGNGVTVREASGFLPGDTKLSLHGTFPNRGKTIAFEGAGELVAPDLRGTLHWLEPLAPSLLHSLPQDLLHTGNLSAKVAFDPGQLSFTDVRGALDGAAAQGGLAVRLGPRLGVSASLTLDRLPLDPWLPDLVTFRDPGTAYATVVKSLAAAGFDADLKLQLHQATWRGAPLGPVSLDMQTDAGHLTVRRLEASASGLHVTVSGSVGDAGRISEGRVELTTQDLAPIKLYLPPDWGMAANVMQGPGNLLVQLAGPPGALAVRAALDLGDLHAEAQPLINLPARRWTGPIMLHHPGAPRLFEKLGFPGTAPWLGDGSFSVIAQTDVAPGHVELGNIELVAGSLRAGGQLAFAGNALEGRIKAETLTLPMVYPSSPIPLPLAALRGVSATLRLEAGQVLVDLTPTVTDFSADISAIGDVLSATGMTAKLSGGTVSGTAKFDLAGTPRLALHAQADNVAITGPLSGGKLDLTAGRLQATADLTGEGYSPAALSATLAGNGKLAIGDATVLGVDMPTIQSAFANPDPAHLSDSLRAALTAGVTTFPLLEIPFDVRRGVVSLQAKASHDAGEASFNGSLDLLDGALEGQLTVQPGPDLPDLPVTISGHARTPVQTPELAALARWLAERP